MQRLKSLRQSFHASASKRSRTKTKSDVLSTIADENNNNNEDEVVDEELSALKQVCLSYIDMIEFEIDSIPEQKTDQSEPDFEGIFLRLKGYISAAKMQLVRQEIDDTEHMHRRLNLDSRAISALPDLPFEDAMATPSVSAAGGDVTSMADTDSHRREATNVSSAFRKLTSTTSLMNLDSQSQTSLMKSEKERIRSEIRVQRRHLKYHKFESLPERAWSEHLLHFLCRSEQFVLSSTCKYCLSRCGIGSYRFEAQFDADNMYWREHFFNFLHPTQDSTLLLDESKFEGLSATQRRQLKYFLMFWAKFKEQRRQRRLQMLQKRLRSRSQESEESELERAEYQEYNDNEQEQEQAQEQQEAELKNNDDEEDGDGDGDAPDDSNNEAAGAEDDDMLVNEEFELDDDLYAADKFEYDDERPRGLVLLEKYCGEYEAMDEFHEDALLQVAIPMNVEQIAITQCKNRNGELAHWVASLFCHLSQESTIDWFSLENNNLLDRDIHRICAGLLNRNTQSNLVGLSLSGNPNITDKCVQVLLKTIAKKCPKLQFLHLSGCTKLSNKACQHILEFFAKTHENQHIELSYVDLSDNYKINDKGIQILNQIYLQPQYTPTNMVPRFYVAGTQWREVMEDWSKNIVLTVPKRR